MTQSDDLDESLRHLEYEMAMMVASPRMLAKHQLTPAQNTARPDGYYWANDRAVAYLAARAIVNTCGSRSFMRPPR